MADAKRKRAAGVEPEKGDYVRLSPSVEDFMDNIIPASGRPQKHTGEHVSRRKRTASSRGRELNGHNFFGAVEMGPWQQADLHTTTPPHEEDLI